jgi:DNA-directed RNA polymerase specialized sigma24 family protein
MEKPDANGEEQVVDMLRLANEGNWGKILLAWQGWLRRRSQILFWRCRDIFAGVTEEDVLAEVQDRFIRKIRELGFAGCATAEEAAKRAHTFVHYCVSETKTEWTRRKRRREITVEDLRDIPDKGDDEPEEECPLQRQMLLVFLRLCIEELESGKQRALGRALLGGMERVEVARVWNEKIQSICALFERMVKNLRSCIDAKRGEQ